MLVLKEHPHGGALTSYPGDGGEGIWEPDGGGVHLKAAGYDKVSELVASATEELMEMSVVSLRANPGRRGRDWEEAGGGRRGG